MDDTLSSVIGIVLLLVFLGMLFLPFALFFVYIGYQNGKRRKIRDRVLGSDARLAANQQRFPARHASQERFKAFFKILPWESAGFIFVSPDEILYAGELMSGAPVSLRFRPEEVRWLGKQAFPNGAVSWFEVRTPAGSHYFTSETGFFIFGSDRTTKAICEQVAARRGQAAGPPAFG
jgi:hypothetical protein